MADRRGAYELLSDGEGSSAKVKQYDYRLRNTLAFFAGTLQLLSARRRILFIASGIFILFTVFFYHATHGSALVSPLDERLDAVHLEYLAAPIANPNISTVGDEKAFIVGQHHAVLGDYPEDFSWVDTMSREPFANITYTNGMNNNAMGRMPAGSPYDALVIARGRNGEYVDPTEKIKYLNLTIVAFFANFDAQKGEWHRAGPEPYILDLPVWRQYPRPCSNLVNGGAADPRFLWSDAGEPLAIIGTSSRVAGVCKAVGVIDLRAAWPDLKSHLVEIGYGDIPIKINTFTEVGKADKKEKYEKNWAAFFPGPIPAARHVSFLSSLLDSWRARLPESTWPHFASQIVPRSIVKVDPTLDTSERASDSYILSHTIDLSLRDNDTISTADSDCIVRSLPSTWDAKAFHQATPFHRVTFCPRGTCVPSRHNTVLLGLIHYKKARRSYRRMFVTMRTDAPFEILSVSPPLHFGSAEIDEEVVFSVSMAFLPTKSAEQEAEGEYQFLESKDTPGGYLSHGWLDDTLVVGAGLRDAAYDSIHLPVSTALHGHTLCS